MASTVEQITSMTNHLEVSILNLRISFVGSELQELTSIANKLNSIAARIRQRVGPVKPLVENNVWETTSEMRIKSQSIIIDLISTGKLESRSTFVRNIVLIFNGPNHHVLDSKATSLKKRATQKRCEKLRKLSPDGILSWAISYEPSSWTGGIMGNDKFDCLLEDVDPKSAQPWPACVHEELQRLRSFDALGNSPTFISFADCKYIENSRAGLYSLAAAIIDPIDDTGEEEDTVLEEIPCAHPPAMENRGSKIVSFHTRRC